MSKLRPEVRYMYECAICQSVNHSTHHHCSVCGTIPAQYSILGAPTRVIEHESLSRFIPVVAAFGVLRAAQHYASRIYLRTVTLDYYSEGV